MIFYNLNITINRFVFIALVSLNISQIVAQSNYFESSKNLEIFSEIYKELDMFYVDEVNSGKLISTAIDEMLISLDPYTTYIPESDIEDYRFMTTGQYGGIGAIITKKGNYILISEPYEGSPAQVAGLKAGDKILRVNGKDASNKTTEELSSILKGTPNTQVNITIERGELGVMDFSFNRKKISLPSIPYSKYISDGIGYIKLRSFTRNCAKETKEALVKLKKEGLLKGLILDLRSNPGGLLNESIDIVNLFIDKGEEIVITKGKIKDWEKSYKSRNEPVDLETPLVVLINSSSASASEIVSGSIQDLDRGVIIGRRSYGKGLVQQTRKLPYNSQLKVTVAKYYIPSGRCIQALDYSNRNEDGSVGKIPDSLVSVYKTKNGREVKDGGGITPDIVVESPELSDITISLLKKRLFFDFATEYSYQYKSIANLEDFEVNTQIFESFKSFLLDKEYDYLTPVEQAFNDFKIVLEKEELNDIVDKEITFINERILTNKENDLNNNKEEISQYLANEIVSRYYYQKGRIAQDLKTDIDIKRAIQILKNPEDYNNIIN